MNSSFKEKSSLNYALCIEEYFWGDEWNMINFNGRHVIDIGGNNGDTSLYFAQEGAEVIGFEPVKHLFDLALENIELNKGLKDKITYINKGVGGKKGKLKINADSVKDYIDDGNYDMEITTLTEILNTYNFKPDVLKIDCEGCEFEIVEKEDLSMFNDIILEHHSLFTGKPYENITQKLENQGFKIDFYPVIDYTFDKIGLIHAYKQ